MNILYIEHYAGSPELGMEFRPYYLSREWIRQGHRVTILAGDYSHLRKKNPSVQKDFQSEIIDGIEYVWIKTGSYQENGIKRAVTMERFVRKLYCHAGKIAEKWKPDVVIASSTYPLDTFPAQKIAKKSKAKYIHEVHDMWPATLYEVGGMSRNHPFVTAMQIAEDSAYKHCDRCVSLLPYAKEYMVEHGLAPEKFVNIQNGVAEEEWNTSQKIPPQHEQFFEEHKDKFIVGYFGGHSVSNALDYALDVAKAFLTRDNEVIFVFVGDGVEKPRLMEKAKTENLSNVFFLPPVAKAAVPDLLRHFDCSYMTGMKSPLYRFGLSLNKMYDSMMAGIPIVCAFDSPKTLVSLHECGIECLPTTENVVSAINELKSLTPQQRLKMGQNAIDAIKSDYTYEKLAKRFESLF